VTYSLNRMAHSLRSCRSEVRIFSGAPSSPSNDTSLLLCRFALSFPSRLPITPTGLSGDAGSASAPQTATRPVRPAPHAAPSGFAQDYVVLVDGQPNALRLSDTVDDGVRYRVSGHAEDVPSSAGYRVIRPGLFLRLSGVAF
jgi:hypothetical protein